MASIFEAHSFAIVAHAGQIDKGGQPYIRHLERVANASVARAGHAKSVDRLALDPMQVMQAAILHDVLEDTPTTPVALRAEGFPDAVIAMVVMLTKPPEPMPLPYDVRIAALIAKGNLGAILIKMSDTEDNLSPDRTLKDGEARRAAYAEAFGRLKAAAASLGYTGA
ncbi:HD domain-containing protein [Methylobacterium sp. Leaf117]|uniref:HD domain-containing protein n=1 Tax=Methylobacterium sp. Leaf117 TaxID=1736260 RepID=UPI0006F82D33|nr:HD domain-containing protein [Methylobacterium sp. Leaf117]KQP96784.1 phosphohydrolase [Methylobacterium sp. Leaf117]